MGAASSSSLVDSALHGDIQQLKLTLRSHNAPSEDVTGSAWELELEEALHTVVAAELKSCQQLQQLQIALELLLHTRPEAWSSIASSQDFSDTDNAETNESVISNAALWSACHRACATGNLVFVAFVLQHHPLQFNVQIRDVFGLFPIDLVPPELLMSATEIADTLGEVPDKMILRTARTRRCIVLQRLRECKAELQDEQVRCLLGDSESKGVRLMNSQDEEEVARVGDFYVTFKPNREYLSTDQACNMGHVHELGACLLVKFRVPRADPFLNGYFQLIWRELGDARSEEPNYDTSIIKLRDENVRFLDQEAPLQSQQSVKAQNDRAGIKDSSSLQYREGSTSSPVVEGSFFINVAHLPADSVCHVLFIACDRHLLHRTIALSTEGLAVQAADIDDPESDESYSDSTCEDDEHEEGICKQKQDGHTFYVGGEEFSHPNPVFTGQSFPDVETFESFLRDLRVKNSAACKRDKASPSAW